MTCKITKELHDVLFLHLYLKIEKNKFNLIGHLMKRPAQTNYCIFMDLLNNILFFVFVILFNIFAPTIIFIITLCTILLNKFQFDTILKPAIKINTSKKIIKFSVENGKTFWQDLTFFFFYHAVCLNFNVVLARFRFFFLTWLRVKK